MELIIDNRENIKIINSKINVKYSNLQVGDYILSKKNIIYFIIERKTIQDYANSIRDGRYREQKQRLLSNYTLSQIIYLIEGDFCDYHKLNFSKIKNDTVYSSMINLMFRDNIKVIHTNSKEESQYIIENLYHKLEKQDLTFLEKKSNYQEALVNNVSIKKNKNIDKDTCFKIMLHSVPGISNKIADRIVLNFESIKHMIDILSPMNYQEKFEYLQDLPDTSEKVKKIPINVVDNIINYLL